MIASNQHLFYFARQGVQKIPPPVGLKNEEINDLEQKIKSYEELMVTKDLSKTEIRKHNRIISKSLKECMNLFEVGLNPLMRVLGKTNPEETRQYFEQCRVQKQVGRKKKRNKNKKSKIKTAKPNILQQKSPEEILHRFAELAMAE
ncbi:MAG: hypothetical protein ABI855_01360 [Bacteroidota bacterium]